MFQMERKTCFGWTEKRNINQSINQLINPLKPVKHGTPSSIIRQIDERHL